eukprot:4891036-Amphidinium_carterae.1
MAALHTEEQQVRVSSLMDDLSIAAEGTHAQILASLTGAAHIALPWLQEHGFPLAPGKSVIVSTSAWAGQRLQAELKEHDFRLEPWHRFLGGVAQGTRARRTPLQQQRWTKARKRLHRFQQLRRAGAKVCRQLRAAPVAMAMYGAEQIGVAPGRLHAMRSRFVRTARKLPQRTKPG